VAAVIDLLKLINDAKKLRPLTKQSYANDVRQWLAFAGNDPQNWTALTAQAFYDHLIASGIAIPTANRMITGGLAFALGRAHAFYGIANPIAAVDRYKAPARADGARSALKPAAARALIAACEGAGLRDLRDHAILTVGLYTGMRRMSLISIDLETITDHGAFVTLRVVLKGGDPFNVPLDKRAWDLTARYRDALAKARGDKFGPLFTRLRPQVTSDPRRGYRVEGRITEQGLFLALKERAAAAHVDNFMPHVLRHTFVTWCRGEPARIEPQFVAAITGHAEGRISHPSVALYTDTRALAADASRRCYEAITAKLGEQS
jgi:integrase